MSTSILVTMLATSWHPVAGLTCAHVLGPHHDVVLYEADHRLVVLDGHQRVLVPHTTIAAIFQPTGEVSSRSTRAAASPVTSPPTKRWRPRRTCTSRRSGGTGT